MKAAKLIFLSGILSASAFVTGCSSSDDDGGSTTTTTTAPKATITTENYKDLAVAAAEGSKRATETSSNSAPTDFSSLFKTSESSTILVDKLVRGVREQTLDLSSEICTSGGSVTATIPDNFDINSTNIDFSYDFNNCNDGFTITDGQINMSGDILGSGNFTITYTNFSVTANGVTDSFSGTVTCTNGGLDCDFSGVSQDLSDSDFSGGIDSRSYEYEGSVDVTDNGDGSFDVNATVVDPDHGSIVIVADDIAFGTCTGGQPHAGTITISSNGDTATITFIDCDSFSINFNSSTTTFNWIDI